MGTSGLYGIRKNGIDKVTYSHYDSYPEWLGLHILEFVNQHTAEEISDLFDRIILVESTAKPTDEDIERCKKSTVLNVSDQSTSDWYCLLRGLQGDLEALYQCEFPYMTNDEDFIQDSLYCEYAYIINLDTNMLEYYIGFQSVPTINGRYGCMDNNGYYPCRMVSEIPLDTIMSVSHSDLEFLVRLYMGKRD